MRAWRDKHIDGERVWLRRSRYVAREFAWLSPDRQDLFSPASSVITARLLPTLFMKWKTDGYVLCSIDVGDAFLMVPQEELTQVRCVDASGCHDGVCPWPCATRPEEWVADVARCF